MSVWEGNHFLNPERSFKIKINANSRLEIRETLVPYVSIVLAYLAKVNTGYLQHYFHGEPIIPWITVFPSLISRSEFFKKSSFASKH